ncbi:iron-containing redox enzyme family protein [Micromonospora echinofusca]|uniref:Iron-containing redox enzyme family protein n=1 Tax=Micromonospora echinofusca TaxID=47858 RepID=A0ABS3W0J8_MICEH|nr:iron-containing redox enzyme family protein [Micromonospora echinofusca]MBO4210123.1 iron-containing redox enzyme family protein [Micromonospora echinofusca]
MRLPTSRGPVSAALVDTLRRTPGPLPDGLRDAVRAWARPDPADPVEVVHDEDLHLVLFVCYELHYRGWDGVDDRWEWEPSLLALRRDAESRFERALSALVGPVPALRPEEVPQALLALAAADDGPPLSTTVRRQATIAQFREFVTHRSVYHLREADPHTWAIPRLGGLAKAALIEIQIDEYGGGQLSRMHAHLFRDTARWLGLDTGYGAHVDAVPAVTLAVNNLMSLFGLHRRWRGALLGHLAALEMTSSLPNRRYGDGLRRLGGPPEATRFYDEHVEADAVHEQIATHDMCGAFAVADPEAAGDVWFGAACCLALERLFATHLLDRWQAGATSLRVLVPAG